MMNNILTLDLETTGLDPQRDNILLIGYSVNKGPICQFIHGDNSLERACFEEYLKNKYVIKRGHNIKFDVLFLKYNGYEVKGPLDDTAILSYLEDPFRSNGLKYLVENKLNKKVQHIEELIEQTKKDLGLPKNRILPLEKIPLDLWKPYNADDVINCDLLRNSISETPWYTQVEQPLISVLTKMEYRGIMLDRKHLENLKNEYEEKLKDLQSQLGTINPKSPKQVTERLKSTGVCLKEKTAKGADKADKLVLKKLAWMGNADAKILLAYREISKLQNTYVMPLLQKSDIDGRIHGSFNQAGSEGGNGGTKTGRLTSSGPNLQNIPDRTAEGRKIRKAFIPSPGMIMIDSDLKQIEPRLVAHYTQNKFLLEAYAKGKDTHAIMGGIIFNKDPQSLTKIERFIGKTCWLADFYGCSAKKLKVICETVSEEELPQVFDDTYFANVKKSLQRGNPRLYEWREQHIESVRKFGSIQTLGGRNIRIPNISSKNLYERLAAEREAVNYLIQGSAAEIMKMILVRLDKELPGHLLATIHDEVLMEFVIHECNDLEVSCVNDIMCNTAKLNNVSIEADTRIINNWSEK